MGKKSVETTLGRALIKNQARSKRKKAGHSLLHTSDLQDGSDWNRINFASITDETDIDSFLSTAELAGTDFKAEKLNIKFVRPASEGVLTKSEQKKIHQLQQENKSLLRIPRRPAWDRSMTPEELSQLERESFLEWRRSLSTLKEKEGIILTPYEKNLEFWRQLWRVIERSDVVVQIVDARNPLLFRCEDLQHYVKEVDSRKEYLLLVNKSDFLTDKQRQCWSEYLNQVGISAVFFSALCDNLDSIEEEDSDGQDSELQEGIEAAPEDDGSSHVQDCNVVNGKDEVEDFKKAVSECEKNLQDLSLRLNNVLNNAEGYIKISITDRCTSNKVECDNYNTSTTSFMNNSEDCNLDRSPEDYNLDRSPEDYNLDRSSKDYNLDHLSSDYLEDVTFKRESGSFVQNKYNECVQVSDKKSSEIDRGECTQEEDKEQEKHSEYVGSSTLLSKEQLIDVFRSYFGRRHLHPNRVTVGLVGYPNVGKSSTINSLLSAKKVSVSATPGKTKHFQTHFVSDDLLLCDCPGLVFPAFVSTKAEMIVSGILPIDQMRDHVPPTNIVLHRIPRIILESYYGVSIPKPLDGEEETRPPTSEEFLSVYGFARGMMSQRGTADQPRAARYILKDYVTGRLLYCHSPPTYSQEEYHIFDVSRVKRVVIEPTPQMKKTLYRPSEDLDEQFFEKPATSHFKGPQMIQTGVRLSEYGSTSSLSKPWRDAHRDKRNRKQKLRKRFAHLDQ